MRHKTACVILGIWALLTVPAAAQDKKAGEPKKDTETVFTTFRVKDGQEAEFQKVYAEAWSTYRRFKMVVATPHLLLRGADSAGKTYFIEILTWIDADKPDNAPAEVKTLWAKMEALCEKRDGHRGIEFSEVKVVP